MIDDVDRAIINALQGGFPVCERPFAEAALGLGLSEDDLIARIGRMRTEGVLSRFGPMYNADRFGGHNTLVAMEVPEDRFDEVTAAVNAFPEVAHNYRRAHAFNMWFVVAAESEAEVLRVLTEVEAATGLSTYNMPKIKEFHVGLRFEA